MALVENVCGNCWKVVIWAHGHAGWFLLLYEVWSWSGYECWSCLPSGWGRNLPSRSCHDSQRWYCWRKTPSVSKSCHLHQISSWFNNHVFTQNRCTALWTAETNCHKINRWCTSLFYWSTACRVIITQCRHRKYIACSCLKTAFEKSITVYKPGTLLWHFGNGTYQWGELCKKLQLKSE